MATGVGSMNGKGKGNGGRNAEGKEMERREGM